MCQKTFLLKSILELITLGDEAQVGSNEVDFGVKKFQDK